MTVRSVLQANRIIRKESKIGPRTAIDLCKKSCRLVYNVPSDGSATAAIAGPRTKVNIRPSRRWYPGAFDWWVGGENGDGHVTIRAFKRGYVWSKDILRPGMWDRVPLEHISLTWTLLKHSHTSKDIDGVQVVK